MGRPARLPPVLVAFLAFAFGVGLGGVLGPALAILRAVPVVAVAFACLRVRGLRAPSVALPVVVLVLAGVGRAGVEPLPNGGRAPAVRLPEAPSSLEVRIARSVRRDRIATVAEAWLTRPAAGIPAGTQVRVRVRGYAVLEEGATCVLHGRIVPPRPPPEALDASWLRPAGWIDILPGGPDDIVTVRLPGGAQAGGFDRARAVLASRIRLSVPDDAGDFALAVLLGEGSGIDPGVRDDLSVLGTAHVLSVSGLHVAAAAFLVGLLVVRLAGPLLTRRSQAVNLVALHLVASTGAAWLVARLAGLPAPAVRSAGMFTVAAVGRWSGRPQAVEDAIGATGLLSIAVAPFDVFSISFLLSYGAMLGLAFLAAPIEALLVPVRPSRFVRASARLVAASVAASLATTPVTVLFLGSASWAGPLANLIAIPATTLVVMPAALLLLVVAAVFPAILPVVAPPVTWILDAFLASQAWMARVMPGDGVVSDRWVAAAMVGACTCAFSALAGAKVRTSVVLAGLAALATLAILPAPSPTGGLRVSFLDVGKGDAILVECPTGLRFLVDAGEERTAASDNGLLSRLRDRGVDRIDGLVVTHADEDHAGGVPAVLAAIPVGFVAWPCPDEGQPLVRRASSVAQEAGVPTRCLLAGMQALPGCADDTRVLWPPAFEPLARNAASVVFAIAWLGRKILLTGDLEEAQEQVLVDRGAVPAADVLKLGHHGGRASSSPDFLAAVRPAIAVVSGFATRQRRNLPVETADRVAATGARLVATRLSGDVLVRIDAAGRLYWTGRRLPSGREIRTYVRVPAESIPRGCPESW